MSILIRPTAQGRYLLRVAGQDELDCATFDTALSYLADLLLAIKI